MFRKLGTETITAEIDEEQLSELNSLHANEPMRAAYVFGDAYGPERAGPFGNWGDFDDAE